MADPSITEFILKYGTWLFSLLFGWQVKVNRDLHGRASKLKDNLQDMKPQQLLITQIRPVLKEIGLWSAIAETLVLGTAIHESDGLEMVTQYHDGPARSYFQMEPATLDDLYENFLKYRPALLRALESYKIAGLSNEDNLHRNLAYAIAACRLQYYRVKEPLPREIKGVAQYWKTHWNTKMGKGTVKSFLENWEKHSL